MTASNSDNIDIEKALGAPEPVAVGDVSVNRDDIVLSTQPVAPIAPSHNRSESKQTVEFAFERPINYHRRTVSTNTWRLSGSSTIFEKSSQLPEKRYPRFIRHARHTFLNVYRRLFGFVFLANLIGLVALIATNPRFDPAPLSAFATAAAANVMVAVWIRQDYVVNLLFKLCWLVPLSSPLRIRRLLAKVYEYGGVHSGTAFATVVWFTLLTAYLTKEFSQDLLTDPAIIALSYILLTILAALCITAYPKFRFKSHNTFEQVHRWGGWFSLAIFWAELVLFSRVLSKQPGTWSTSLGITLIMQPAFWFLLVASLHCILPWLRLHKMPVNVEKLSNHAARVHFDEKIPNFVGLRIAETPLGEWHSFATIPARGGKTGGSIIVSDAGDWTRKTIQNPKPYYYVKGVPVTGVLCMAQIFKSVIIVTTGSGIGPCLGVMLDLPKTKCRVLWSTPRPYQTYGEEIVEQVKGVDDRAVIIDTRASGRPDLVQLAWELFMEEEAEAVFVISNPALTRKVVYGMESRGVPAFGPIWDS